MKSTKLRATSAKMKLAAKEYDRALNDPKAVSKDIQEAARILRKVTNEFKEQWEEIRHPAYRNER